ncbi:MAG TPA: aspartate kinase [Clostridiales bacterium]|nr:aspartate kinase [Clostridiales bacterium]
MLVCKFGGTSMSDAASVKQAVDIIKSNPKRKVIVVSAPGKLKDQDKVTDILIQCFNTVKSGGSCKQLFPKIERRFQDIVENLGIDIDLSDEFEEISRKIDAGASYDYTASRGEYLMALVLSKYLGYEFVDARDIIKFDSQNIFDSELTNTLSKSAFEGLTAKGMVAPGFYGSNPKGEICAFSRGGSDITGAILARALKAELYENWTDVNGFMMCDPKIVKNPKSIHSLTYKELRELSYMGAGVLHPEAIFPVSRAGIPINIRNTFEPDNPGTMIVPSKEYRRNSRIITGIAGKKNFTVIHIEKSMMNSELGFARRALSVLEEHQISIEHMPTGIDTLGLVIESRNIEGKLDSVLANLQAILSPDHIEVLDDLSLIATVGHGMSQRKGTAARLFGALYDADINVRLIDQGSSELNIIIGVDNKDFEKSIEAIYYAFVD